MTRLYLLLLLLAVAGLSGTLHAETPKVLQVEARKFKQLSNERLKALASERL